MTRRSIVLLLAASAASAFLLLARGRGRGQPHANAALLRPARLDQAHPRGRHRHRAAPPIQRRGPETHSTWSRSTTPAITPITPSAGRQAHTCAASSAPAPPTCESHVAIGGSLLVFTGNPGTLTTAPASTSAQPAAWSPQRDPRHQRRLRHRRQDPTPRPDPPCDFVEVPTQKGATNEAPHTPHRRQASPSAGEVVMTIKTQISTILALTAGMLALATTAAAAGPQTSYRDANERAGAAPNAQTSIPNAADAHARSQTAPATPNASAQHLDVIERAAAAATTPTRASPPAMSTCSWDRRRRSDPRASRRPEPSRTASTGARPRSARPRRSCSRCSSGRASSSPAVLAAG